MSLSLSLSLSLSPSITVTYVDYHQICRGLVLSYKSNLEKSLKIQAWFASILPTQTTWQPSSAGVTVVMNSAFTNDACKADFTNGCPFSAKSMYALRHHGSKWSKYMSTSQSQQQVLGRSSWVLLVSYVSSGHSWTMLDLSEEFKRKLAKWTQLVIMSASSSFTKWITWPSQLKTKQICQPACFFFSFQWQMSPSWRNPFAPKG